jgi:hypothetical protein
MLLNLYQLERTLDSRALLRGRPQIPVNVNRKWHTLANEVIVQ